MVTEAEVSENMVEPSALVRAFLLHHNMAEGATCGDRAWPLLLSF